MSTPPKMKRLAYHAWLAPEGVERPDLLPETELSYHHVVVTNGDQLRAELQANALKLKAADSPMHLTNLWLWAALVRTKVLDVKFQDFKARLVAFDPDRTRDEPHDKPAADLDELDADPTAASSA